jgi:glycosyltransferase involved in cell wall biosynthesis
MPRNASRPIDLSIIVPLYNEVGTFDELHRRLNEVILLLGLNTEIIYVDDGSTDATWAAIEAVSAHDWRVQPIRLARNYGQTAGLAAGFDAARGAVIVAMDGDLQHEPEEIPTLLAKIDEGYDVVSGWRERRVDGYWTRRLPSKIANWLMAQLSGVSLHDFGTTFKAYRAPVIKRVRLYGDLHRFIPALTSWSGAKIAEVPIKNVPRPQNTSNYGLSRTWRVMADLLTVRFLLKYVTRPLHLFGPLGFASAGAGVMVAAWIALTKIVTGAPVFLAHGPLLLLSAVLIQTGILLVGLGLLAELLTRIYMDGERRRIYTVARARPAQLPQWAAARSAVVDAHVVRQ